MDDFLLDCYYIKATIIDKLFSHLLPHTSKIINMENLTSQDLIYGLFSLCVIIVALFLIRKVAGCLIKTIIMAVIVAVLVAIYLGVVKV